MKKFFKRLLSNPQTTIAGITSIGAAVATVSSMVKGSTSVTPETVSAAGGLLATGAGLLFASDAAKAE